MDSSGVHTIVNASARARQLRPPAGAPARPAGRRPRLRADRQLRRRRERRRRTGRAVRPGAPATRRGRRRVMSATAPSRGAAETVPIEHETFDRIVRTLVFGVPPVALAVAGWLAWGGTLHWHDLVVLGDHLHADRAGHHRRLPPALHASQLQDRPRGASAARRARLDGGRGPGDRVGRHPSQAPPLLRPAAATRTAPTSTRRRGGAARCADWPTPTSAGCSAARTWPTPPATPRTCWPTATCASSAAPSPCGSRSAWPSRSAWASP